MAMPRGEVTYKGKALPIPPEVAHRISLRAASIVRQTAPRGPNNSRRFIRETWQKGQVGVHIPPQAIHLYYLDQGIRPFVMKNLEGKTIPIRNPDGSISFRRAKGVGKPSILTRDESGKIIHSKIRWRYPGVEPMNFIQPAINQAIQEWIAAQKPRDMMTLLQKAPGDLGRFFRKLKRGR